MSLISRSMIREVTSKEKTGSMLEEQPAIREMVPVGATVKTVAVDINPAVVTKLADRGSWQTVGLVTDAELFLRELCLSLQE